MREVAGNYAHRVNHSCSVVPGNRVNLGQQITAAFPRVKSRNGPHVSPRIKLNIAETRLIGYESMPLRPHDIAVPSKRLQLQSSPA